MYYVSPLVQSTSTFSMISEELYICNIINKNTKNAIITKPIIGVVPQPGATLPYSEFNGRKISPNLVLNGFFTGFFTGVFDGIKILCSFNKLIFILYVI